MFLPTLLLLLLRAVVVYFKPKPIIIERAYMAHENSKDQEILKAIRNIKFGSVEVVIHDSKIVGIEKTEKIRFQPVSK